MHRALSLVVLAFAVMAVPALAQVTFEPPTACGNVYPIGLGSGTGPEGVRWNGASGTFNFPVADNIANNAGFPTQGSQYLRVTQNGPFAVGLGLCATGSQVGSSLPPIASNVNQVYVPIPSGGNIPFLSFEWDWYNAEGGPTATFNDGCAIDVIDSANNVLQAIVAADSSCTTGPLSDTGGACAGTFGPETGANSGVELVNITGPLPAGSAFVRISAWNGGDNAVSGDCVVDNFQFGPPCLLTISGVNVGPNYVISIANSNCNPFALTYTCITVLPTTVGWFFGIDPSIGEILAQVNSGVPPFIQVLDAAGNSLFSATLPFNGPLGIPLNGVTVYLDALFVPTPATPATSVTI
jgi:hypothetical protein